MLYIDAGTYGFYMGAYAQRQGMTAAIQASDQFLQGKVRVCLDDRESLRKQQYPWYKSNRNSLPQATIDLQKLAREWLKRAWHRYPKDIFLYEAGLEADDVIAQHAIAGTDLILSNDKDLLQLIGPYGEEQILVNAHMEPWGIARLQKYTKVPLQFGERSLAFQLCTGDIADNIPRGLLPRDRRSLAWIFANHSPLAAACSGGPIPIPKLIELLNCLIIPTPLYEKLDPLLYVHNYYGLNPVTMEYEAELKESQSWRRI